MRFRLLLLSLFLTVRSAFGITNGLALTPMMGWNPWESFALYSTATDISNAALCLHTNGMQAAGYNIIGICDDGWMNGRDGNGNPIVVTTGMPGNTMKPVCDYIHSLGFKVAGYVAVAQYPYNNVNNQTVGCGGHETNDFQIFANWGWDLVKLDYLTTYSTDAQKSNEVYIIRGAINHTGRPMVVSLPLYASWGPQFGNSGRVGDDMIDRWNYGGNAGHYGCLTNNLIQSYNVTSPSSIEINTAGPGYWNDLDNMVLGINGQGQGSNPDNQSGTGMTTNEYQVQMGMWAITASPIIAGTHYTNINAPFTLKLYTNSDIIGIDQDPLGKQGQIAAFLNGNTDQQLWVKPMTHGVAIALLNKSATNSVMTASWSTVFGSPIIASVRDSWNQTNLGTFPNSFTVTVLSHQALIYTVQNLGAYAINGRVITNAFHL